MSFAGGVRTDFGYRIEGGRFASGWGDVGPGTPLAAAERVRAWDFPVGINTVVRPRSLGPFDFTQLRAFSNVELVRLAIETRKDQIERLDWRVKPSRSRPGDDAAADPRVDALELFWRKLDGTTPFAPWLRLAMEDLLVLNAPASKRRRSRSGALIGLDIAPGDTIHRMVEKTGQPERRRSDLYGPATGARTTTRVSRRSSGLSSRSIGCCAATPAARLLHGGQHAGRPAERAGGPEPGPDT
jgi:hypothetical protein